MTDVAINNEDIIVVSSLDAIDVKIDVGPTGPRGSSIFVGYGPPSTAAGGTLEGQSVLPNDLYIATDTSYMYKLGNQATPIWEKLFKLGEVLLSTSLTVPFEQGVGIKNIPYADILGPLGKVLDESKLSVYCQVENYANPCMLNVVKSDQTIDNVENLQLSFNLIEADFSATPPTLSKPGVSGSSVNRDIRILITLRVA